MWRTATMVSDSRVLVVGASAEEFAHVKECLTGWECVTAPLNDEETAVASVPDGATLIVVYARKVEKNTMAICE